MGAGSKFGKADRLRTRREFLTVQSQGVKVSTPQFVALALHNAYDRPRIGITVSRRVGGAVERARLRRRIRELFRNRRQMLPQSIDLVVIAKPPAKESDAEALGASFDAIARQLKGLFSCPS